MREPLYIVIVAGQSNAPGLSPVAGLEESQCKTYENLPIFLDTNYPHPYAPCEWELGKRLAKELLKIK